MAESFQVLLNGAQGRMGQAIAAAATNAGAKIVAGIDIGDSPDPGLAMCDVVIDFSFHEATAALAEASAKQGKPLVIGTTGHTSEERSRIVAVTEKIPVVWAGNYSIGVNLLFYLVGKAASILGPDYHPEVVEMHHRHKKDAPSGTAERMVELILEARKLQSEQVRHGRKGITGERPDAEVGVHALRGGDVVGEHTALFAGEGERLELTHRATDRRIFAQGALRAASWVLGRQPGLYNMEDVLGLR